MKLKAVNAGIFALVLSLFSTLSLGQDFSQYDDPETQRVEPFQVFDNLYYVGTEWVSSWVLETDQGLILFDTLYDGMVDFAIDGIRQLGMDPNDIRYIVVTHAHYDHIGGAKRIQEEFGGVVLMTQQDWDMAAGEPVYRDYPKPMMQLAVNEGTSLRLGRTNLTFFHTPGHTPGVLSTLFTVYDKGYPHTAFMFGGVGLNFSGVEQTQMYIDTVKRLQTIEGIEVNVSNHASAGDIFGRNRQLMLRRPSQPHPFVDPEGFTSWLDELLVNAEAKMVEEQAAAN
jgi:metallo-beta-lactamase class B